MCDIQDKLSMLLKNDNDGKVILLLAKLIDDRFSQISNKQVELKEEMRKINETICLVKENRREIDCLKKEMDALEAVRFFNRHPKLGMIFFVFLVLGIILAYIAGLDSLFLLFK